MKHRGKNYKSLVEKIEKGKLYSKEEAVKLVKEISNTKFDATVEVAMNLNLDVKKADQQLRGALKLPNGTGKVVKVFVIAKKLVLIMLEILTCYKKSKKKIGSISML